MKRREVMLLGGTGFIGSALAKRLHDDGVSVHVLGRTDGGRIEELLPRCGTVVHLASATTPGSSANDAGLELANLALTARLLACLQRHRDTHLVFFSSGGAIYGNPASLPVAEDAALTPLSNHGAGKAAQEMFCQAARAQGHAVTILRPSNAYGPGQRLKGGFGLVRTMLEHARLGTPLEIWGDGHNVRDFIYIDDVVEACTRFISLPEDAGTYNLGTGTGISVNELKRIIEATTGRELASVYRPRRAVDVRSIVLDSSRLNARLGWHPPIGLTEGVARTWNWLTQR